ncbi:MAG: DegT/DnrJ/EryC1/StrS family aminotransferase [Candidatus Alcyoniella australis]|nr:DegT/DnrJ/EryC1/StrS family aminotransferase [Candidatus Alcyoniella australis]
MELIPITRPTLVPLEQLLPDLEKIWHSGIVTQGPYTVRLEQAAAALAGTGYCVALNSCTSGLILTLAALELSGEVLMPSFTWASTAHAALWNRLDPVFCDVLPGELTIDPDDAEQRITPRTKALLATNVFGMPPDIQRLERLCDKHGLALIFDAAQGIGARRGGRPQGSFGRAEVFSLSPTKVVTALEGGLVTTDDEQLDARVRSMRDYGKGLGPDGPDIVRLGLSARISEVQAAVGIAQLGLLGRLSRARAALTDRYRSQLSGLTGVGFQTTPESTTSANTYFVIQIGPECRLQRDELARQMAEHSIQTKPYFWPPVHQQTATKSYARGALPVTQEVSRRSLALPLWSDMPLSAQDRVIETLYRLLGD